MFDSFFRPGHSFAAALLAFLLSFALLLSPVTPAAAQEEPAEEAGETGQKEDKELSFGGTPYMYTGPDTGFGVGFAILYRDMFGKKGRDTTFSFSYTETMYQYYSLDWQEPYFLSQNGRLKISLAYETKPAIRFWGIGNDLPRDDQGANYSWISYNVTPAYIYRFPRTSVGVIGIRGRVTAKFADPNEEQIDEPYADEFNRDIAEVYPALFESGQFDGNWLIGPGVTIYLDSRKDRFPLGGGREEVVWPLSGFYTEVSYDRYDEAFGSDFSINKLTVDLRTYFPLYFKDTILAARGRVQLNQGDVPFYEMADHSLRGYYGGRFRDKHQTLYNVELRQGFFPDAELPLFGGLIKLRYPSLLLFWESSRLYDDYTEIPEEWGDDWHYTWGYGFRFVVTPSVVIRFEQGFSDEQATFSMNAGLPF